MTKNVSEKSINNILDYVGGEGKVRPSLQRLPMSPLIPLPIARIKSPKSRTRNTGSILQRNHGRPPRSQERREPPSSPLPVVRCVLMTSVEVVREM